MKKQRDRIICVQVSDPHGGNKLGLLNPETKIQMEAPGGIVYDVPGMTEASRYLWYDIWTGLCITEIAKLADGDPIIGFFTGDWTQGNKYQAQWVSQYVDDQVQIGVDICKPFYKLPNVVSVRFVSGTSAHNFGNAASEKLIVNQLKVLYPKVNTDFVFHGLATIKTPNADIDIDFAHHGPYHGSRNWLKGNEARLYLRSIMMDEIQAGSKPPNLVLRGHYHTYVSEYLAITNASHEYQSWIVIAPSVCLLGDHGRQATKSAYRLTNGVVCYEIVEGKLMPPIKLVKPIDTRSKEIIYG